MPRQVPFSKNRQVIYDLLTRARRYHCSVNGVYEFDVTDTLRRLKEARRGGRAIGLTALLVQATAQLLEKHPRMNHHLFHGLFGPKEVAFDHISCTLVVGRKSPTGESILLPVLLRDPHRRSLEEIAAEIRHHQEEDLEQLPQFAAFERLKRLPRLGLKYVSYKARSDPKFYERYFGTYGLSSLVTMGWGATAASTLANTASTFLPGTIRDQPVVVGGEVRVRRILTMLFVADHYVVDGQEILAGMKDLRPMLESPRLDSSEPS